MNLNLNFDSFYELAKLVFKPISNLLNSIKVNGTSLLVIMVTLFLVLLLLRFVLRAPGTGLSELGSANSRNKRERDSRAASEQRSQFYKSANQYFKNHRGKS